MSAICGILFKNINVNADDSKAVMDELGKYSFDKSGAFCEGSVFLGCHINYVTPESLAEILPYEDPSNSFVITADAIIDNRDELFELLSIPEKNRNLADSLLILEAYKKWGSSCTDRLVGDYSFSIWDKRKEELFCVRDHTGKRTFYYYNGNDVFAFSTLMNPLFKLKGLKKQLNETYIADFLSIPGIQHEIDAALTIYKDILQLPPAHAMTVNKNGIKLWRHWTIEKTKEIHFDTDKEYEEAFRKVYFEAVKCRLRSIKKVGIMLSGGLDSGSAACIAAAELNKRHQTLYSFTQVPMDSYKDYLPAGKLADERKYVEEICKFAGNIESRYIMSEGKNPLTEIDERISIFEQPYKTLGNSYWQNAIFKSASDMDIGILLGGQSGNATISWGSFKAYILYLLKTMQVKTFFKELESYSVLKNKNSKRLCLGILFNFMPHPIKAFNRKINGYKKTPSIINRRFYRLMKVSKRFRQFNFKPWDSFDERMKLLSEATFSHLGAAETKNSLAFGIERRDPTRDKRVIEFCMNLPENQWVRDGNERRFIRCAMKGYMPDKVRTNTTVRGRQAADWVQRIMPEWEKAWEEIAAIGEHELERKYLDIPKIKQLLNENKELKFDDDGSTDIKFLIRALIFSRFLRSLKSDL